MDRIKSLIHENLANTLSVVRMMLAIGVICLTYEPIETSTYYLLQGLIVFAFLLDGVDGTVARRLGKSSQFGSFLDIFGDRVVEFVFIYRFFFAHLLPAWFPIIFYLRILLTDFCRYVAFGNAKVMPSGIYIPKRLRGLVLSPVSRILYGAIKMFLFIYLFALLHFASIGFVSPGPYSLLLVAMTSVICFSLLRAFPILYTYSGQGFEYIAQRSIGLLRSLIGFHFRMPDPLSNFRSWINTKSIIQRVQLFQVTLDVMAIGMFSIFSFR
jgi:phosphatidylglycerophosphate synthase